MMIKSRLLLAVISGSLFLIWACQQVSETALYASSKTKADFISDILVQLANSYSVDPLVTGKTFTVIIKDFNLEDAETYALVEGIGEFWIVVLPAERKKIYGTDQELCVCRSYPVARVTKDVVEMTRKMGFVRQFTVP